MFSLVAALAFIAAGCGGGGAPAADASGTTGTGGTGGTTATTPTDGSTAQPAGTTTDPNAAPATCATPDPATGVCPVAAAPVGAAPSAVTAPGSQVTASDASPKDFTKAVGKKVIVVMLYQPEAYLSDIERGQVLLALKGTKATTVFLQYKAADYHIYTDIPEKLGLFGTPSIAIIDRAGNVQNFWIGFVDFQLLAKAISVAGTVKQAAVSPSDAPPSADGSKAVPNSAVPDPTTAGGSPAVAGAGAAATTTGAGATTPAADGSTAAATTPAATTPTA